MPSQKHHNQNWKNAKLLRTCKELGFVVEQKANKVTVKAPSGEFYKGHDGCKLYFPLLRFIKTSQFWMDRMEDMYVLNDEEEDNVNYGDKENSSENVVISEETKPVASSKTKKILQKPQQKGISIVNWSPENLPEIKPIPKKPVASGRIKKQTHPKLSNNHVKAPPPAVPAWTSGQTTSILSLFEIMEEEEIENQAQMDISEVPDTKQVGWSANSAESPKPTLSQIILQQEHRLQELKIQQRQQEIIASKQNEVKQAKTWNTGPVETPTKSRPPSSPKPTANVPVKPPHQPNFSVKSAPNAFVKSVSNASVKPTPSSPVKNLAQNVMSNLVINREPVPQKNQYLENPLPVEVAAINSEPISANNLVLKQQTELDEEAYFFFLKGVDHIVKEVDTQKEKSNVKRKHSTNNLWTTIKKKKV